MWADGGWWLKDLGSKNGTFVDGRRIEAGVQHRIVVNTRIAFGRAEDPWMLDDDGPPEAMALNLLTREVRQGAGGLVALPSDAAPQVVVVQRSDGHWTVEGPDEADPGAAQDRQTVHVGGAAWCLLLPDPQEATPLLPAALGLEAVRFRFGVSRDEERVTLTLVGPHREIPVQVREFNYVLLTLARVRQAERDLTAADRGWIEREALLRMLKMSSTALNVAIHRARQHLLALGLVGAAGIVEVRRRARRFGSDRIDIGPLRDEG